MEQTENSADADSDKPSFEQALNRLDETVKALESGGLSLAEATRLFEDGMKLARICSEMLASAELRVSRIQTAYGEQMHLLQSEEEATPGEE